MPNHRHTRLVQVLGGCIAVSLAATACSADFIETRQRPHKPAPTTQATSELGRPSAIDPSTLQVGKTSQSKNYTFTKPMVGMPGNVSWQVFRETTPIDPASTATSVVFGAPSSYTTIPGVLTFRGNHARNAPTYGKADIRATKLEIVWTHDVGAVRAEGSYFPGAGWTGQPLLVQWPMKTKEAIGFSTKQIINKSFVEVIYPTFDGKIYRLDLATGRPTKDPIDATWGFKGTASIDPRGYPLLYAGQGLNQTDTKKDGPWEYRIFDLISNKQISSWSGTDPVSKRTKPSTWGAFDSSALVHGDADTIIEPGENGVIYKAKLNASFDPSAKTVSVAPEITKMVYQTPISNQRGIESSAAAWRNLLYGSDNDGNVICWDANTLNIVWAQADSNADNSDATIVVDDTPQGPFIYTGNSVGWRGRGRANQVTNLRKIDALTGKVAWQVDVPAYFNWHVKGGLLATPLLGKGDVSDLVIFNVGRTSAPSEGNLIAVDRKSGEIVWNRHLNKYSWSSPVLIEGTDGHQYGVFGDSAGLLHLFDPATGRDYSTVSLGSNIEASVAAFDNMIVVASYDKKIFGIKVS